MKIISIIIVLLLMSIAILGQTTYGLEVEHENAKIKGKLNLEYGSRNILLGNLAGGNLPNTVGAFGNFDNILIGHLAGNASPTTTTYHGNVFIGSEVGKQMSGGWENVIIGYRAAFLKEGGDYNVFVGVGTGLSNLNGEGNVFIGSGAGSMNDGSDNVFLGRSAGRNEAGSDLLYIDNSSTSEPLIYGEFANDRIEINGSFHIRDFARLIPSANAPVNPELGTIYFDSGDNKVKVWTGIWENLN